MSELINPKPLDNTAVWLNKPSQPEVEARVFPAHAVKKLLADKNTGWEVCDPEFVPKTQVRPHDEGKSTQAMKNANTERTGLQIKEMTKKTFTELKALAVKEGVNIQGIRSQKGMLEALDKAGKL